MEVTGWAPEHSDALREYLAQGMSFAKIAKTINARFNTDYTRSAAIGRARRLGLSTPDGSPPVTPRPTPVPQLNRSSEPRERQPRSIEFPWPMPMFEKAPQVELRCVEIAPRHLSLVELEYGDCRYPYGGDSDGEPITFCGHRRRPGSSYCTPHFHLSRNPELETEPSPSTVPLHLSEPA
ncbi:MULTISPECIES: GcrA family cell cycle regulator [unclassified Bradyrhizobium]